MTHLTSPVERWKTPDDLKRWIVQRMHRLVTAELRTPGTAIEPFSITTPDLSAGRIADHFAAVRVWTASWQEAASSLAGLDIEWTDWDTRSFGRVRIPRSAHIASLDVAARLAARSRDVILARQRIAALTSVDARLIEMAHQWPAIIAVTEPDFVVLCRFLRQIVDRGVPTMRLREVPCAGMHTKFLEQHRALLVSALAALGVPPNPNARTWAGKLGFVEDETRQFELRDLDGALLPYPHLALPVSELTSCPVKEVAQATLHGVVIVENQATFRALPALPGVLAIFGRGEAVRTLGSAAWLTSKPLLYSGDLDHAGFMMVAGLRRDGLRRLETGLMDSETALGFKDYWVDDTSRAGPMQAYADLTAEERSVQKLMAAGPWRLEQERLPFDLWLERLRRWRQSPVASH